MGGARKKRKESVPSLLQWQKRMDSRNRGDGSIYNIHKREGKRGGEKGSSPPHHQRISDEQRRDGREGGGAGSASQSYEGGEPVYHFSRNRLSGMALKIQLSKERRVDRDVVGVGKEKKKRDISS